MLDNLPEFKALPCIEFNYINSGRKQRGRNKNTFPEYAGCNKLPARVEYFKSDFILVVFVFNRKIIRYRIGINLDCFIEFRGYDIRCDIFYHV